jgi:uncharacterized protein YjdB
MKKLLSAFSLLGLLLVGCQGTSSSSPVSTPEPTLGTITVNPTSLTLELEQIKNLSATTSDSNVEASFTAADTSIVSVSSFGAVLAKKIGETTVKVSAPGHSDVLVPVSVVPVIHLASTSATIYLEGIDPLDSTIHPATTATILPTSNPATTVYTYTSGNTAIATVSSDGIVTPVAVGDAVITITNDKNASAEFNVTVKAPNFAPASVQFNLTLSAELAEYINVYVAGTFLKGSWEPTNVDLKLTKVDALHYTGTFDDSFVARGPLNYKYNLGTSATEGKAAWFGEKVNGSPTDSRLVELDGGLNIFDDTNWPWENIPPEPTDFVVGPALIKYVVVLPRELVTGEYIRLVGDEKSTGLNWDATSATNDLLKIADKTYAISKSTAVGGDLISYKFIIGNLESDAWTGIIQIAGDDNNGNLGAVVDGGLWIYTHTIATLPDTFTGFVIATREITPDESVILVPITFVVPAALVEVLVAKDPDISWYIVGNLGQAKQWGALIGEESNKLVAGAEGSLQVTIELQAGLGIEFKIAGTGDVWTSNANISLTAVGPYTYTFTEITF